MVTFHVGFQHAGGARMSVWAPGAPGTTHAPWALTVPARAEVYARRNASPMIIATLDPFALTVTAVALDTAALHYFRLADGTIKPLPAAPPPLSFQAGDVYVAVTPGAASLAASQPGGPSAAIARFLHLRDYFNADKLATAVLAHLHAQDDGADAEGAGVLVIEAR